jgi:hypothetical protein
MVVENYISELLLRHNCLIIPGFGGFVARYAPAKIDWNKGVISPPSKELLFNKHLIQSDGLFVNHIATQEKLTFSAATSRVDAIVHDWKTTLRSGGRVEIDKVGMLYQDNHDNLVFEQDRFFNLLLSSFGLREVTFVAEEKVEQRTVERVVHAANPVLEESTKEETPIVTLHAAPELVVAEEHVIPITPPTKSRFNWKYLAAAAFIPIGFFSLWIPMKTDVLHSGKIAFADFNPFRSMPEANYGTEKLTNSSIDEELHYSWEEITKDLPPEIEVFNYRFSDDLYIPVRLLNKNAVVEHDDMQIAAPAVVESGNYHLIAGCFGQEANANNLVADLQGKGFNAQILDVNKGLHRVSIAAFSSKDAASAQLSELSQQGISTWVLKK